MATGSVMGRRGTLALLLAVLAVPTVSPAGEPKPVTRSDLAGIRFGEPAVQVPSDAAILEAATGFTGGTACRGVETYAWPVEPGGQARMDRVHGGMMDAMSVGGYRLEERAGGPEDASLFLATGPDRTLLMAWTAPDDGLVLVLCDTGAAAQAASASAPGGGKAAAALVGTWVGSYTCGQGRTGAHVAFERVDDAGPTGVISFFALPGNPDVPSGSFRFRGAYDPVTGSLSLVPVAWVERPPGYTMVRTEGRVDLAAGTYSGSLGAPGCEEFEVRRELMARKDR